DDQVKKRLDQATAHRDIALLRRIVAETFCSRHTDRALDLLGDLAFERGDFAEAERVWRMLVLPASESEGQAAKPAIDVTDLRLLFPDSQVDQALVRAKQILTLLFRGQHAAAAEEAKAFRANHPRSEGQLAGRKGNYADILEQLIAQPEPPTGHDEAEWTTFAGSAERNLVLPRMPRCRWLDE